MTKYCYARRTCALGLAARAHRTQIRKGTATADLKAEDLDDLDVALKPEVPYFMHPAAVGMLLLEHQESDDVVIAGVLHDVLEDTVLTKEVLQQTFGAEVSRLVTAASEPDKSLSWRERKQHTIDHLSTCADSRARARRSLLKPKRWSSRKTGLNAVTPAKSSFGWQPNNVHRMGRRTANLRSDKPFPGTSAARDRS